MVYFANITFGSIVVSWRQDRNLKHRCSTWSYQNIPPRSVSCIEQKQSDNEFSLDDLSEMSLSLGGLAVSRSGNCREPICTKCHVVTKMKYKFSKYRIVQNHCLAAIFDHAYLNRWQQTDRAMREANQNSKLLRPVCSSCKGLVLFHQSW